MSNFGHLEYPVRVLNLSPLSFYNYSFKNKSNWLRSLKKQNKHTRDIDINEMDTHNKISETQSRKKNHLRYPPYLAGEPNLQRTN